MERIRSLCFWAVVLAALGVCLGSGQDGQCARAVAVQKRIDCHPQPGASQEACEARGCTWCATDVPNAPWCFFPKDSPYGYSLGGSTEKTAQGWRVTLNKRQALSLFGNDISPVILEVEFQTKDRLRFRLYDPNRQRFEVPLKIDSPGVTADEANYDVEFVDDSSHFRIKRKSTGTVLWDSPLIDLFFSNQYLQITTTVPSTSVYGFGEHEHLSFKHSMDFVTYGMFSRDQAPTPFANLYGVHPFYMCVEADSNAHGVLLLNSNAQDVSLSPNPSLTFRTIGGILDFYVFLGPTPENVIQQYTEAVGRPHMPAYWSLGFHLSRWGYGSIDVLKQTVDRMHHYDIPYDVQHLDIDYMERRLDFTYDKVNYAGLPEYLQQLKKEGMHNVVILESQTKPHRPSHQLHIDNGNSSLYSYNRFASNLFSKIHSHEGSSSSAVVDHEKLHGAAVKTNSSSGGPRQGPSGGPRSLNSNSHSDREQLQDKNNAKLTGYITDPFITKDEEPGTYRPYDLGEEMGIWVNNSDGVTPAVGKAWPPGDSVFPDYTNPRTVEWWTQMCLELKDVLDYDGIWIDMNEPSNFLRGQYPGCAVNDFNNPPYVPRSHEHLQLVPVVLAINPANISPGKPGCLNNANMQQEVDTQISLTGVFVSEDPNMRIPAVVAQRSRQANGISDISDRSLAQKTLCPDSKTYLGEHYNTHSLFGWSQTAPTFHVVQQATGKRAFVLSRSTFVGSGKHGGHWLGDNFSQWKDMHYSIIGILEFNLFGIPYIGADICGFNYNTTYELCLRWMQLGSFYPFSRNHNAEGNSEQDPAVFGEEFAKISRATLQIRYSLLPYLYTLFFESHVHGNTVVRSLMHEFTADQQTHGIDTAFLWGPAFMIAPVLQEGARSVDVYFPEAPWFDYYTGHKVPSTWKKNYATVAAPLSKIPLFIRGGYILPEQAPATTTTKSRLNPFGLIIALDEQGEASGSLFWDDGDSIDTIEKENYFLAKYTYSKGNLKTEILKNGYRGADTLKYNKITILGLKLRPHAVALNGRTIHGDAFSYELSGKLILWISAPLTQELNITIY